MRTILIFSFLFFLSLSPSGWTVMGFGIGFEEKEDRKICGIVQYDVEAQKVVGPVYHIEYEYAEDLTAFLQQKWAGEEKSLKEQFEAYGFSIENETLKLYSHYNPRECTLVCNRDIEGEDFFDEGLFPQGPEGIPHSAYYQGKYLEKMEEDYVVKPLFAYRSSEMPDGARVMQVLRKKEETSPPMKQKGYAPLSFCYRKVTGEVGEKTFAELEEQRDPILVEIGKAATFLTMLSYGLHPMVYKKDSNSNGTYGSFRNHLESPDWGLTNYFITVSICSSSAETAKTLLKRDLSERDVLTFLDESTKAAEGKKEQEKDLAAMIKRLNRQKIEYAQGTDYLLALRITSIGKSQFLVQSTKVFKVNPLQQKQRELKDILAREAEGTLSQGESSHQPIRNPTERLRIVEKLLQDAKDADDSWGQPDQDAEAEEEEGLVNVQKDDSSDDERDEASSSTGTTRDTTLSVMGPSSSSVGVPSELVEDL